MKIKKKIIAVLSISIIFASLFFNSPLINGPQRNIKDVPKSSNDSLLTIYTYESLLADPGYDFIGGYANYSGISKDRINIELLDDANSIISRAVMEKGSPTADVLIGLDNILIHTAKKNGILEPYNSPVLENISSDLIDNLDPEKYLLPYDYGIIALYYDTDIINSTNTPVLENLTLNDIIDSNLAQKLIVEDPTLSSTGLGFLLWTIAVFGDSTIDFEGILGEDWRDWWSEASDDLRITPSWGAAFSEWYGNQSRSLMVSYGSSPAYSACLYSDYSQKAVLSHEGGKQNAWLQIEGLGLVKDAPNIEQAKDFIDWFLSEELQNNIPENNWMYPANINTNVSQCFSSVAINPDDDINILNDLISPSMLNSCLDQWMNDWEIVIVSGQSPKIAGFSNYFLLITCMGCIGAISFKFVIKKFRNLKR